MAVNARNALRAHDRAREFGAAAAITDPMDTMNVPYATASDPATVAS